MNDAPEFKPRSDAEAMLDVERRAWTRLFPRGEDADVELRLGDGQLWPATVVDESFGGITLLVSSKVPAADGDAVEVVCHGAAMSCTIRNINDRGDHVRVGCEWCSRSR